MTIEGWSAEAFNQVPDSANEIHGDRVAALYGFEGGLVPGVTVSACLMHPAVTAWGRDFLDRGRAEVRVVAPLYDGDRFTVALEAQDANGYRASLCRSDGTPSASAEVQLPDDPGPPPVRRGDPVAAEGWQGEAATPERWARLQDEGCVAVRHRWDPEHRMASYVRDRAALPDVLSGPDACANAAFVLGCSNWILATNARMNPWVHLQTTSRHFRAIAAGTSVVAEMTVAAFYEKKGHRFVDVAVALFDERDDAALATVDLRAIYRLRGL